MKAAALWPAAVVGALLVTVGANVAILVLANNSDRAVVEPNYYRRAVAWDSTLAQSARNDALGWRVEASLQAEDRERARVRVRVTDRAGAPVSGAIVRVEAIHNRAAASRSVVGLTESGGGEYAAVARMGHRGLWELRVIAERHGERFTADIRRELAAGEAGR